MTGIDPEERGRASVVIVGTWTVVVVVVWSLWQWAEGLGVWW